MKKLLSIVLCLALLMGMGTAGVFSAAAEEVTTAGLTYDADTVWSPNAGNPLFPGYIGDPFIYRDPVDGTFYVYGTTDSASSVFCVWYSKDLVNWECTPFEFEEGSSLAGSSSLWAPAITHGPDGRYYFYYIANGYNCYVASAPTPKGPFRGENNNQVLAPGMFDTDVVTLSDGKSYVVTICGFRDQPGTNFGVYIGELNDDMVSLKDGLKKVYTGDDLFEGPGLFERDGKYYITYSDGSLSGSYHVNYAIADNVWGPYVADEANNPILYPDYTQETICTGHSNIIEIDGDYYISYHRKTASDTDRQACLEKVEFYSDGSIRQIHPSINGTRPNLPLTETAQNLALEVKASASSYSSSSRQGNRDWVADYAFDNNNATLWHASGTGDEWIEVDLGSLCTVDKVSTFFELHHLAYQYKLEYSVDGETWELYADKLSNTDAKSPQTDVKTVQARYLRMSFENGVPFNGTSPVGIFEMKVYGTPGANLRLDGIAVDGQPIEPFAAQVTAYTAWTESAADAVITYTAADPDGVDVVVSAVDNNTATLTVTSKDTEEQNVYTLHLNELGTALAGTTISAQPAMSGKGGDMAMDGKANTYYEFTEAQGGYVGLDLGASTRAQITSLSFLPRAGYAARMTGGVFQGSNDGVTWTELYKVETEPAYTTTYVKIESAEAYRLVRYLGPSGSYANVAEIAFYGELSTVSDAEALRSSIAYAEGLQANVYTTDSYAALQTALETAQAAGTDALEGAQLIDEAIHALQVVDTTMATPYPAPDAENGEYLYNTSFEDTASRYWESTWYPKSESSNVRSGSYAINVYGSGRMRQTVTGLPEGTYTFSIWVHGDAQQAGDSLEIYAVSGGVTYSEQVSLSGWQKWGNFLVRDIEVTDGTVTVGFVSKTLSGSGMWAWIDDVELAPQQPGTPLEEALARVARLDTSLYTTDSVATLEKAYQAASAVNANALATDVMRSDVLRELLEAEAGLVPLVPPEYTLGDVNADGAVDSKDARMVLQYAVSAVTLSYTQRQAADYNRDSTIDSKDARAILQKAVS